VDQPNRILANSIVGHKAARRSRAGEEMHAATKHDGTEIEPILINKTKISQASCELWSPDFNLASAFSFEPTYHRLNVLFYERGVSNLVRRTLHGPSLTR
jgi:hypothetical protein